MPTFRYRTRIEAPAKTVFDWHAQPGALERLTPPWQTVEIVERTGGIQSGARVVLLLHLGPLRQRWVAEHRDYIEGCQFRDVQIEGPFARWEHTHRIEPDGPTACYLEDHIEYALPLAPISNCVAGEFVRGELERLFRYRHYVTAHDIAVHAHSQGGSPMHIMVTGASGLIGAALVPFLTGGGHQVTRAVRSQPKTDEVHWNPDVGVIESAKLEDLDAVVHLAGENIADGRWTPEKKARIRDSRVNGTRLVSQTLAALERKPRVLVCASAIGFYGDRGADVLTEASPAGSGFLADVCKEWEAATEPAAQAGIRVVNARIGIVFTPRGGALQKMLLPFKLGLGGVIGHGRQYWSWISIDDVIGAIHHLITNEQLSGPVNLVAPRAVTNAEFTKTLGRVLSRPTIFPMPAFAAQLAFGEMADALLLASARVEPARLLESGYQFRHPDLEGALRHLLGA
ncbi:MAG: TIGR01777 family oxidoreductase [Blastocatellia bacterium]|nr:TIGR01777 family oxidoreductase [Blastocatellia bacterium]